MGAAEPLEQGQVCADGQHLAPALLQLCFAGCCGASWVCGDDGLVGQAVPTRCSVVVKGLGSVSGWAMWQERERGQGHSPCMEVLSIEQECFGLINFLAIHQGTY